MGNPRIDTQLWPDLEPVLRTYPAVFSDAACRFESCVFIGVLKSNERPVTFNDTLYELLSLIGLPTLTIGGYRPPS